LVDEVREVLRPLLCDEQGQWTADYVRLRFAAILVQIKTAVALLGWETAVS
jgi:hypothetical protein